MGMWAMHAPWEDSATPTFVLVEVRQVFLVGEDDGLILGDNLPPEALPARRQLPQLFQLTNSVNKTHIAGHRADSPPLELCREPIEYRRSSCAALGTWPAVTPPV